VTGSADLTPLRLGRVAFINTYPVEWALSRHLPEGEAVEIAGVPTALNRMLRAGEIDVANCSSIEYASAPEQYVLLPSLCVGSDGAVDSVQLITDLPLDRVRSIAATSQSATSATLVRVLLPEATLVAEDASADARLLIGDEALRSALEDPTRHHDLGELWRERTGRPMVFAVWAARAEIASERLAAVDRALRAAVVEASENARQVALDAAERFGFPAGFLARYFDRLRYRFGPRERAGLEQFYAMAAEIGVIEHAPPLRFADAALPVS
jgi:chorismate dehydratase